MPTFRQFFPNDRIIPQSNSRIQGSRNNQIFFLMKLSTHDIMTVPSDDIHTVSTLIIPYPHGLIITGRQNPGKLMMEKSSSDVVTMPI